MIVRNVVLRIVGLSAVMQRLGGRFPPFRRWEGDMVQLRVVPEYNAKVFSVMVLIFCFVMVMIRLVPVPLHPFVPLIL